jgi:uncharacterized protein YxeA
MIGVVVLLAVLLAVAIGNLFVLKSRYTQDQLFVTIALFSLIAAVVVFALFTVARVTTGGQGPWGKEQRGSGVEFPEERPQLFATANVCSNRLKE